MRHATFAILILGMAAIAASPQQAAKSALNASASAAQSQSDAISGDWIATFNVQGTPMQGELTLKLDGDRLSGTIHTDHTGTGTLTNTSFKDNSIAFRAEFAAHPPVEMTARLQDGKLTGEFRVPEEGMQGTWQATRR